MNGVVRKQVRAVLGAFVLAGAVLAGAGPSGCSCTPPVTEPPGSPVGAITTRAVEGGHELVLSGLERAVTSLQVDVALEGAEASALQPAGAVRHDLLEAGLDAPKSTFTAVVADTRRILLTEGAVAKIVVDGSGGVGAPRLSRGIAVDDQGNKRSLTILVP